jgi:hypothetical protein
MLKKHSYENALTMLKDLTKSSDPQVAGFAYDRLAVCYTEELGVKADPALARKYSEKAIKLGFGDALTRLAVRQKNEGNLTEALANLRRAVATSRLANYHLGLMYYNGDGVQKDEALGVRYLQAAAEANHTGSQFFLANLTLHRSPAAPTLQQAIDYATQAEANGRTEAGKVRDELEKRLRGDESNGEEVARPRSS